jgi:hypothetical protein
MKDKFRELSVDEQNMLVTILGREKNKRLAERPGYVNAMHVSLGCRVKFFYQGNFTVAVLRDPRGDTMRIGVAKRNAGLDPPRRIAGERQALRRAFLNPTLGADVSNDDVLELNVGEPRTATAGGCA